MTLVIFLTVCLFGNALAYANIANWAKTESGIDGRITNGNLAYPKQIPYQAGLRIYRSFRSSWCGGSLISDRWIVTAAHCIDDLTTGMDVYLGAWNHKDPTEEFQNIIFVSRKNMIVHENWNEKTVENDIALIKLPVRVEFNEYVQPISLPKISAPFQSYAGKEAIASGWGLTSDATTGITDKLRWIQMPILENDACIGYYPNYLKSTNICLQATEGKSICDADSGGPLAYRDGASNVLIGITSFGSYMGCEAGYPGVFTRVTSYLNWIEANSGIVNK